MTTPSHADRAMPANATPSACKRPAEGMPPPCTEPATGTSHTMTAQSSATPPCPFAFENLVLASASPRRSLLLRELGLEGFAICAAAVEEHEDPLSCPKEMVRHNARIKAEWVSRNAPRSLVLGADTTVALENEVLNKPADMAQARTMLRKLSGRSHTVYTGICLISAADGLHEVHHVTSEVTFRPMNDDAISAYFAIVNPLDKAGAYGIQEGRERIIANLQGSLENVMGLPIQFLLERWQALGCWQRLKALHGTPQR